MDHATQVRLMHRIFALLDRQSTELGAVPMCNPTATYTSAEQLACEREVLFRGAPLFLGLSGDAAAPGDYFTHFLGGVPILVVRGGDGRLRAFVDRCRHRGARVATGAGSGNGRFTCPYHGWTYDDRGRLIGQPCREGFDGLAAGELGLAGLPVAERHGMIFVRAGGGDAIDVDAHLGGAEQELAPLHLDGYVRFARHETERAMNWKLVVESFLEAYHVPALHAGTLGAAIVGAPAAWDGFGRGGRMVAVRRSLAELRQRPEAEWNLLEHSVVLYQLFPNTVLIHQIDHVEVVQAYPGTGGADSATVVFTLYTPAPASGSAARHFQSNFDLLIEVSEREDFRVLEEIQAGLRAGGHDTVIYGRNEPGVAHYHRMINEALGLGRGTFPVEPRRNDVSTPDLPLPRGRG